MLLVTCYLHYKLNKIILVLLGVLGKGTKYNQSDEHGVWKLSQNSKLYHPGQINTGIEFQFSTITLL